MRATTLAIIDLILSENISFASHLTHKTLNVTPSFNPSHPLADPPPPLRRTGHQTEDAGPLQPPGTRQPSATSPEDCKFPDIIVDTDGCIILCTECDSSSIGQSSDGYQCRRCGNQWNIKGVHNE
jgi:hypothetical protein